MVAFASPNIRGLVKAANDNNISKDDIVSIQKENNQFILIYYV